MDPETLHSENERVRKGGSPKAHEKNAASGKLFARERIRLLVDEGSFVEDGLLANALHKDLPADGVITGTATIQQRTVALMANDSTVKAGSSRSQISSGTSSPSRRDRSGSPGNTSARTRWPSAATRATRCRHLSLLHYRT